MKIKHVYGNVLKLDIPLTIKIRTMEGDVPAEREEPFYPDAAKGCIVELANNYNRKIQYDATVSGNVAHIEDDGIISIGTYKVTVKCHDEYGNPYRYMVRDIVEICDATIDAGIEAGVEFNAETYTLDGAVFVSYGVEQVQSDWNEQDDESKAYIKNKPDLTQYATKNELREVESEIPTLPDHIVTDEHYVHTDNNYTTEEKQKLANAITEEQDPTVPQWAKQSTKPSYTPQEVGALPANTPLFDGDYNSLTNKPDLSGFITVSVNNLVNYYLKSETYTKQEVQGLIAAIQQFHYEIYASTSAVTSPAGNVLYLIGPTGTGADKYEEYVYDSTKQEPWVKIGDTSIDLSGYYTSQQTDAAITSALNTALADYTTTANLTTLLAGKQDVINDLATIRSGAQAGATAYQKPQAGIPKTDLAQGVKDSLDLADTALQEDTLYVNVNNNGREYVDLGLPSGTLWAKCNVGADDETGYGNYYMYGKGARQYNSEDAIYEGTENPLDLSVDTARQVLGGSWRMPTQAQMQELVNSTTYEWVTINGINGGKFTAAIGNYVFFPAAGWYDKGSQYDVGNYGYCWGSSTDGSFNAYFLSIDDGSVGDSGRKFGYSVRGVILPEKTQLKKDLDSKANKSEMSVVDGTGANADKTTITLKDGTSATVLKSHQDISGKQDALVSGTNIKTINNESVLGSGNINIVTELPNNLAYTSNDNGEGIIPSDGIRAVTVTSAAAMTVNPDVVTVIDGAVGTAAITLQVPQDNLAHVWDILMTTDSSVAITFAMSNSATILTPSGFSVGASKHVEISVIGVGTKYYLRYGEFA